MEHYGMLPGLETCKQTSIQKTELEMMDVLTSVVLSYFHIVSMLLSVLKINLASVLLEDALDDNVRINYMLGRRTKITYSRL